MRRSNGIVSFVRLPGALSYRFSYPRPRGRMSGRRYFNFVRFLRISVILTERPRQHTRRPRTVRRAWVGR